MSLKPNKIKRKLQNGDPVLCLFQRIPDPLVTEMLCAFGAELIIIDREHFYHNPETVANIIRAADGYGVSCLVRVCEPNPGVIGNYLDMGAAGILLTDSEGAADVRKAVDAMKYAPVGHRGVSTDSRACRFGTMLPACEHATYFNDNTILAVVVETPNAVKELDEILAIPEVDALSVGDGDLSFAMGHAGDPKHPEMLALRGDVYQRILASGKRALDKAGDAESAERALADGKRVLYVSSDAALLADALKRHIDPIRALWRGEASDD